MEALAPLQSCIDYAIDKVGSDLGFTLKLEQKISLLKFASGRAVFVTVIDCIDCISAVFETVMALTATATKSTRKFVINSLSMQMPEIVYIPPARENIMYAVMDKPRGDDAICEVFKCTVEKLKIERSNMGRVIIFWKTYNSVISIYQFFKNSLGEYLLIQ